MASKPIQAFIGTFICCLILFSLILSFVFINLNIEGAILIAILLAALIGVVGGGILAFNVWLSNN